MHPFKSFATKAIHDGYTFDQHGAIVQGISTATTFAQGTPGVPLGDYEYSRTANPTRTAYEGALASVENANYGLVFSSGVGAIMSVAHLLSSGDHVLCVEDVYGGTHRYFKQMSEKFGISIDYIDATDASKFVSAMKPETKMVWIESPTNPTLRLCDIKAISEGVHTIKKDVIVCVDNTFCSAYFQRPLDLGADVVVHSLTKYMNGHCDAIIGAAMFNDVKLKDQVAFFQNSLGAVPSPFDCYLGHRGLKTLALRMKQHAENALAIATFLEKSQYISKVIYPGLPSHEQHELAKRQMAGFSGIVSFYIQGDSILVQRFLTELKLFTLAESLGGIESLIEIPALMTHHGLTPENRQRLGILDNFVRMSVGIEDVEDLIQDLNSALIKAQN